MPKPYEQRKHFFQKCSLLRTGGSNIVPTREYPELNLPLELKPKKAEHEKDRPAAGDHAQDILHRARTNVHQDHHRRRTGNGQADIDRRDGGRVAFQQAVLSSWDRRRSAVALDGWY